MQQALNNVAKGRTMVVIAHRLSTIRDADNIIVMAKGETIEQGTHDELIDRNGAYARLVKAQDLGRGAAKTEKDVDKNGKVEDLDRPTTQVSSTAGTSAGIALDDEEQYGLLRGLWYVVKEQPNLWPHLIITILCSIAGGESIPDQH